MPFSLRSLRAAWWALAAVLSSSCLSPRPPTQVVVYVEAQPLVREETVMLEVAVRAGPRGDLTPLADTYVYEVADGDVYPRDFTFVPLGGDLSRIFEVEATAYDASRRIITVARLRAGFVEHQARTLRLTLEDRCRGIVCPTGATCRGGRCVQLVDPTEDAGVDLDAGVPDDAPPAPCDEDADCDDGVFCNGAEVCKSGTCQPADVVNCDDGVDCTEDVCSGGGCNHLPDPSGCTAGPDPSCDPTNGCQYSVCDATTCVSTGCVTAACEGTLCRRTPLCGGATPLCCGGACVAAGCDDGLSCTNDYCDESVPSTAGCVHEPIEEGSCDDGDACTGDGTCRGERCVGAAPIDCNDGNPCTDDSCDAVAGCLHVADDTNPYDDGNPCTIGDRCAAGVATAGAPMACNDGVACTNDRCVGGTCMFEPADTNCTASSGGRCDPTNGCQYGTCSAATCVPLDACEIATCVGSTCQRTPRCPGGVCCGGTCCSDDGNACTTTACVSGGCGHVNNSLACDDGNACTNGDTCSGGACTGTAVVCPPLGACRTNTCVGGTCTPGEVPERTPCEADGNACTMDLCARGTCVGGAATTCTDLNPCTDDRCNPATGLCEFPPAPAETSCGFAFDCNVSLCDGAGTCQTTYACSGLEVCCNGVFCTPRSDC